MPSSKRSDGAKKAAAEGLQPSQEAVGQQMAERIRELEAANEMLRQEVDERKQAEVEVHVARELAEKIIDTVREPMLVLDVNLRVQSANASFYHNFQVEPGETVGRLVYELGSGQWDIPPLRELLENVLPENKVFNNFEVRHDFENLGKRVMFLNARRIDHLQLILLAIEDITERKQVEETLQESEVRFRLVTDAVPQLIWTNDAKGNANYFNRRWFEYSGLSYRQSAGPGWQAIVHPDDASASVERWQHTLAADEMFETEYRLRRADGLYRWHLGRNIPLHDEEGRTIGWFGTATDIEALKQAEAALRESEERFRLLVEGAHDYAMFLLDPDNRIIFWSAGAERVFGWSEAEALGQSGAIIFTPEDRESGAVQRELYTALSEGRAPDRRWHLRKDGTRLFVDGILIRLDDDAGQVRGFVKIGRDATEQYQAEEALQRAHAELERRVEERTAELREVNTGLQAEIVARQQAETQLQQLASRLTLAEHEERRRISQILHDNLQQLLYGIQLRLAFVREALDTGERERLLKQAEQAINWLDDTIAITRQLTVDLSPPVLPQEGLTAALGWLVAQMKSLHGLQVKVEAEHDFVVADEIRVLLFQFIRELLFNIVKHAKTDRARVVLCEETGGLIIRVSDEGRGFDLETVEARDQAGFGLRSIRERLSLFGGRVEITSRPGEGTQVTIYIPLTLEQRV